MSFPVRMVRACDPVEDRIFFRAEIRVGDKIYTANEDTEEAALNILRATVKELDCAGRVIPLPLEDWLADLRPWIVQA